MEAGADYETDRRVMEAQIRSALCEKQQQVGREAFFFNLPSVDDHCFHNMGVAASLTLSMDSRVRAKIQELYCAKRCGITLIKALLEEYVTSELQQTDTM